MNSKVYSSGPAHRGWRARSVALAIALSGALGCSIYDESLRNGAVVLAGGAGGKTSSSGSAGIGAAATAGRSFGGELIEAGAGGAAGDAGEPATAGAPNSSGGGAGSDGGAGHGGTVGGAGRGGTGGGAGRGGTGGGAGQASGGMAGGGGAGGSSGAPISGGSAGSAGAGVVHELAVGKASSASSQQPANPSSSGNDGQSATRWCAVSGSFPQWWRVDLGESHLLTRVSLQFENADRKYTYAVETSTDDLVYTTQATVDLGIGALQRVSMPSNVSARYVRITVTATVGGVDSAGNPRPTWASFWEASVFGL